MQALVLFVGIILIRNSEQLQVESGTGSAETMCNTPEHEQDFHRCAWWRGMLVVGVLPDLIAVAIVYFCVPESPRYLLYRGKSEELRETLLCIARFNNAEDKLADDGNSLLLPEQQPMGGWATMMGMELLQPPLSHLITSIVGIWCSLAVVVMGGSFLFPIYLEQYVELSREQGYWLMVAMSLIEIPGVFAVFLVIDSPDYGRRGTMLYLAAASVLAALSLSFTWRMGLNTFFAGNLVMRSVGVLPYEIMYVYAAEILPTSHRNTGLAIGNGASKTVGCILPLLLLPLVTHSQFSALAVSQNTNASSSVSLWLPGGGGGGVRQLSQQLEANLTDTMFNTTHTVVEAEAVFGGAERSASNIDSMPGINASGGGSVDAAISVPYLILCMSACVATVFPRPPSVCVVCVCQRETEHASARAGVCVWPWVCVRVYNSACVHLRGACVRVWLCLRTCLRPCLFLIL